MPSESQDQLCSLLLKIPHPDWPVRLLDAAGSRPGAGGLERLVPLQRPQFLESDLSDRPVQEQSIDMRVMPVYAEGAPAAGFSMVHGGAPAMPESLARVCGIEQRGDVSPASEREYV